MNSLIELKKAFKIIDFEGFCLFSDPYGTFFEPLFIRIKRNSHISLTGSSLFLEQFIIKYFE